MTLENTEGTEDSGQRSVESVQIGPLDEGVGFYLENGTWGSPADVREAVFDRDESDSLAVGAGGPGALAGGLGLSPCGGDAPWSVDADDTTTAPTEVGVTVLRQVANTDGWEVTVTDGPTVGVRVEVRDVLPESN